MLTFFDTHAHLDLEPFAGDFAAVRQRLIDGKFPDGFTPPELESVDWTMRGVVLPGIDVASSRCCVELTLHTDFLYAAVGIQPNSVAAITPDNWNRICDLAHHPKVVGIGETGLDRYWDFTPFDIQLELFQKHIELARTVGKPILIHCRDAWDDMLPILRRESSADLKGLIHAFSGKPEQALECVALGFSISFAGAVTYSNKKFVQLWKAAQVVPEERLLIETDSPYMVPHPFRSKLQRNEPCLVAAVAIRLAELRSVCVKQISIATTQNALRLFRLE